jgi:hypothetical protein
MQSPNEKRQKHTNNDLQNTTQKTKAIKQQNPHKNWR